MITQSLEIARLASGVVVLARINEHALDSNPYIARDILMRTDTATGVTVSDVFERAVSEALSLASTDGGFSGRVTIRAGIYTLNRPIEINDTTTDTSVGASVPLLFQGESSGRSNGTVLRTSSAYSSGSLLQLIGAKEIMFREITFRDITRDDPASCDAVLMRAASEIAFHGCRFDSIGGSAITNYTDLTDGVEIRDCEFHAVGVDSNNDSGAPTETTANFTAVILYQARNIRIIDSAFHECGSTAIGLNAVGAFQVLGNRITSNDIHSINGQGHGVYIHNDDDPDHESNVIANNVITGNCGNGIELSRSELGGRRTIIHGNVVSRNGLHPVGGAHRFGMYLGTNDVVVQGNTVVENDGGGIMIPDFPQAQLRNVLVSGNLIARNGGETTYPGDYFRRAGIGLGVPGDGDPTVFPSQIFERASIKIVDNIIECDVNQVYGIGFGAAEDCANRHFLTNFEIAGNTIYGHLYKAIMFSPEESGGTGSATNNLVYGVIRENQGYVSENAGTGSVGKHDDSVTVSHGLELPYTPRAEGFRISPLSDILGKSTFFKENSYWIDPGSITETSFTVRLRNKIGPGFEFSWAYCEPVAVQGAT